MSVSEPEQKKLLVVDDDPWLRQLLAELLTDEGYLVTEASNGREASQHVRCDPPDAVILDVNLPGRSGARVLEDLRSAEDTRSVPVVLVSGECDLVETGYARQAMAAFHKPLDVAALLHRLAETLRQS